MRKLIDLTYGQKLVRNIVEEIDYDIYKDLYVYEDPEDGDYSLYQKLEEKAKAIDVLYEGNNMLEALQAAGVDNWEGHEEAMDILNQEENQ